MHQRDAFDAAARGEHVILATGTASGKSLGFNLPVLDAIARDPKNRALYLYPTKALSQDQARALAELKAPNVRAAIYDGDTPAERRWQIRKWANIDADEPRHAPRRGPAASRPLGRCAAQPALHRRGRGARVPRRLRLPRRQRAPASAPPGAGLRSRPAVPARLGDDRQPGRARGQARRSRGDRRRHRRRAARRADDPALEPRAARRGARAARKRARRCVEAAWPSSSRAGCGRSASRKAGRPRS